MSVVHTSALAFVPSHGDIYDSIQAIRRTRDRVFHRWMPHVNILYPFIPESEFEAAVPALFEALSSVRPTELSFAEFDYFKNGKSITMFLKPKTIDGEALQLIYQLCLSVFPMCTSNRDFVPHLTVGQGKSQNDLENFLTEVQWDNCGSLPLAHVVLISRASDDTPFTIKWSIPIGGVGQPVPGSNPVVGLPMAMPVVASSRHFKGQVWDEEVKKAASLDLAASAVGGVGINGGAYEIFNSFIRITLSLNPEAVAESGVRGPNATPQQLLFVVDKSGSMGSHFAKVQKAVQYMIDSVAAAGGVSPAFVLYDHEARLVTAQEVLGATRGGRTSFSAAFEAVKGFINGTGMGAEVAVVFMTDGHDVMTRNMELVSQLFASYLSSCGRKVAVHALGFTPSHDRPFLEQLRGMGAREGVYRYAEGRSDSGGGTPTTRGGGDLDTKFEELFDFLVSTHGLDIQIGGRTHSVDADKGITMLGAGAGAGGQSVGGLSVDVVLRRSDVDPNGTLFDGSSEVAVQVLAGGGGSGGGGDDCSGTVVMLAAQAAGVECRLRCVEEMSVRTQAELNDAQRALSDVNVTKVPKRDRIRCAELRAVIQHRLDSLHELFAGAARGQVGVDSLTAQLESMRFEAKFSKARRARAMNKRAAVNAGEADYIERRLVALRAEQERDGSLPIVGCGALELECAISGDTMEEVMVESDRDVMVFALRVARPEFVVDAPTQLQLLNVQCGGVYSFEAWQMTSQYSIRTVGASGAHGGFLAHASGRMDESVGLFKGPDGLSMNACLPMYLHPAHWARVRVQLKPLLGYFFTLDPLGFKEDQYLALYAVLGHMLCRRAAGLLNSDFANWLISDFSKLCHAVKPLALKYLAAGGYTAQSRGDPVRDFIRSHTFRGKDAVPSLHMLLGWDYSATAAGDALPPSPPSHGGAVDSNDALCGGVSAWGAAAAAASAGGSAGGSGGAGGESKEEGAALVEVEQRMWGASVSRSDAAASKIPPRDPDAAAALAVAQAAEAAEQSERFYTAFVEELWRRALGALYKGMPPEGVAMLQEQLLYGPAAVGSDQGGKGVGQPSTGARAAAVGAGGGGAGGCGAGSAAAVSGSHIRNKRGAEKKYEQYALWKLKLLPQSQEGKASLRFRSGPPKGEDEEKEEGRGGRGSARQVKDTQPESDDSGDFVARRVASYRDHPHFFDGLLKGELDKIRGTLRPLAPLLHDRVFGLGFDGVTRRLMLLQALRFRSGSKQRSAVAAGDYANTFDVVSVGGSGSDSSSSSSDARDASVRAALNGLHEGLEEKRRLNTAAVLTSRADFEVAQHMAVCKEALPFAGRLMAHCFNRGGGVFDALLGLLMTGSINGSPIPLLDQKLEAVLTGRMELLPGDTRHSVIANGEAWGSCPVETASRLQAVVGEEAFTRIQNRMHGTCSWVYRASDIPNRHGHSNSHPNPEFLGRKFTGFVFS